MIILCDIIALGICSYVSYSNMKSKQISINKFLTRVFTFLIMSVYIWICIYILYVTTATIGNPYIINVAIGVLSSIVDNVPLVAAAQGMYDIEATGVFAASGEFWQFLAYCAGTGGSALIIGSAAGVAVMGLEKIDFFWYLKKISLLALLGYLGGALVYWLMFA